MAIGGVDAFAGGYFPTSNVNKLNPVSKVYDYSTAQNEAKSLLDDYKSNSATLGTLKKESSEFLTQYTSNMNDLSKSAKALTDGGIQKILYGKDGKTSEESIKKTVSSVKDMVESYNNSLSFLNKNSKRGEGVVNQIGRMATDPAAKEKLDLAGITVKKDGSLALDEKKLTAALSDDNPLQVKLAATAIGDWNGIAGGIAKDAQAGLNTSAGKLIGNDIAEMQQVRDSNSFNEMYTAMRGGGAYYFNNMAAGLMMNMLV